MELADMQDLGSCAAMRWGSNPHARTTILRQSVFVDCRIFFCFSEHLSTPRNPSHYERVTYRRKYYLQRIASRVNITTLEMINMKKF